MIEIRQCHEKVVDVKKMYSKTARELNQRMKLCYSDKLILTVEIIKKALENNKKPVIASSFGKDSVVLLHLVHQIDNTIPVAFNNTGVNFTETIEYMNKLKKDWNLKIYELKPKKTFWEVVKEHGYPKQSRSSKTGDKREPKCCKILKIEPLHRFIKGYKPDIIFVGLLGDEGRQRRWVYIYKGGALYEHKSERVNKCIPLIWWTTKDIWHYHDIEKIPRNPVYEKYEIERTGCIPCTGHIGWKKQLARIKPKLYIKISHDMGQRLISDYR